MEESNKLSLSDDQIEELCILADEAARKYVTSKISKNEVNDLVVSVNLEDAKELIVEIEVELSLSDLYAEEDARKLADEAVKSAFRAIDEYVKEVRCQPKT
ncbi:DUF3194 domain-containing protein [Candidatus Bathyarchaeota archaeon]|nr:DUF3194 domain-containing protein [Candidatus Bathyarchaeota archaeon]